MSNRPSTLDSRQARRMRNKPARGLRARPAAVNENKDRTLHGKARVRAVRAARRAERAS